MTAPVTQKVANPTEIISGERQLLYAEWAQVGEFWASQVPRRETVRLIPNAKLSSLPRNHFAIAVVTATMRDSAPMPNTSRPAAMTGNLPARTVKIAPIKH